MYVNDVQFDVYNYNDNATLQMLKRSKNLFYIQYLTYYTVSIYLQNT